MIIRKVLSFNLGTAKQVLLMKLHSPHLNKRNDDSTIWIRHSTAIWIELLIEGFKMFITPMPLIINDKITLTRMCPLGSRVGWTSILRYRSASGVINIRFLGVASNNCSLYFIFLPSTINDGTRPSCIATVKSPE